MSKRMKILTVATSAVFILALAISGFITSGIVKADDSGTECEKASHHRGPGAPFETLSGILGLTTDEIKAELKDGRTITEIAAEQGLSEKQLQEALYAAMAEKLAEKVAEGSLTQEQADKMLERIKEGKLFGSPSPDDEGGRRGGPGQSFETLSGILSLTTDEIKAALKEGKTITEIAAEQGLSEEQLQEALYAAMAEKLAEKVTDGSLTQEQADKMLERLQGGKLLFSPPHGKGTRGHAPGGSQGNAELSVPTTQTY